MPDGGAACFTHDRRDGEMVGTFGRRLTAGLALTGEPSSDARGRTCGVIGVCGRANAKRRHDGVRAGLEGE